MNQLALKNVELNFLSKTHFGSIQKIGEYIGDIYEYAITNQEESDEEMPDFIIPSRFMLLREAWNGFEDLYMEFIENGYGGRTGEYIRRELEDGIDPDEMVESWREHKYYNASYNMHFTDESTEKVHLTDVANSLLLFNMSYIRDNSGTDIFFSPYLIKAEEWVNPSLVQVW